MIKPEELSIGNYLYGASHRIEIVESISKKDCLTNHYLPEKINAPFLHNLDNLTPIPLTEDILIRLGFDIYDHKELKKARLNDFIISKPNFFDNELWQFAYTDNNSLKNMYKDIRTVHNLQNLIYNLTGKQLTLKEE